MAMGFAFNMNFNISSQHNNNINLYEYITILNNLLFADSWDHCTVIHSLCLLLSLVVALGIIVDILPRIATSLTVAYPNHNISFRSYNVIHPMRFARQVITSYS